MVKERIKKLRKVLDLTQQEFGERIGSTQNAIGNYETGHRSPSSSVVNNICKTFNVNETWLRTGEDGDDAMFIEKSREDEIADAVNQLLNGENAEFKRRLILALSSLTEKQWAVIVEKAEEIVTGRIAQPGTQSVEEKVRAEAEEYHRQRLIEEGSAAGVSASLQEKSA